MSITPVYSIRTFNAPDPATATPEELQQARVFFAAVGRGFHDEDRPEKYVEALLNNVYLDRRVQTGVYVDSVPAFGLDAEIPVATFSTLRNNLNLGRGREIPAHQITSVTVRPSHRRRGLLTRMMSENLAQARNDGLAVAALTASEGSIYGRYGFGVATRERNIHVVTDSRFRLRQQPTGTVELIDPKHLLELAPKLFAAQHARTPGSLVRQHRYAAQASGTFTEKGEPDTALRAALHYDAAGQPDGYVVWKFKGWESEPYAVTLVDLVAADSNSYLSLWQFLASLDLIDRVEAESRPVEDPLEWALVDPRVLEGKGAHDMLWLRILDTEAALSARAYGADGILTLKIEDRLGLADGVFRLEITQGSATVTALPAESEADLSLDVSTLSSLYLGGFAPSLLHDAGLLTEHTSGTVALLGQALSQEAPVHCATHF